MKNQIPASHLPILEEGLLAIVTTIRHKDGLPSTNPVAYEWTGTHLRFSTLKQRVKYKNLLKNNALTVCVIDHADPTRYIEMRGWARIEEDPLGELNNALYKKTTNRDFDLDEPGAERVIVTLEHEQVSAPLLYNGCLEGITEKVKQAEEKTS